MNPDNGVVRITGRRVTLHRDGAPQGRERYPASIRDPCNNLDHNQVAHRREAFERVPRWPEAFDYSSDGHFFRALRAHWSFAGIDEVVA